MYFRIIVSLEVTVGVSSHKLEVSVPFFVMLSSVLDCIHFELIFIFKVVYIVKVVFIFEIVLILRLSSFLRSSSFLMS